MRVSKLGDSTSDYKSNSRVGDPEDQILKTRKKLRRINNGRY